MQKKLLACLLVAPVAGTAMANVAIPQESFPADKAQSVTGTDLGFKFDFANGGLLAPIGAGTVKFQAVKLAPGTYNLNITNADNLTVTVAGKNTNIASGNGKVSFKLNAETEVTVEMTAIDADKAFSCTGAALEVVIDEANVNAALTALLAAVPEPVALRDDVENKDLAAQYTQLGKDKAAIEENIAKIVKGTLTIEDYTTFELWKAPEKCTIGVAIANLGKETKSYNEAADEANTAAADAAAIAAYVEGLEDTAKGWQDALDAVKAAAATDKVKEAEKAADEEGWVLAQIQEAVDTFQGEIDKFTKAIADQKGGLTVENGEVVGFVSPVRPATMNRKSEELANAVSDAIANLNAWNAYQAALASLNKVYNENYTLINSKTSVEGVDDVFGTERAKAINELTVLLNANNNTVAPEGGELLALGSPAADLNAAAAALPAVEEEMNGVYTKFNTLVTNQNEAYTTAQEVVTKFEERFEKAQTDEKNIPEAQKENYKNLVDAANTAINNLKTYISEQYAANTLLGENYADLVAAAETAIGNLENATQNYEPLLGLQTALTEAIDKVKEIDEALDKKIAENNWPAYDLEAKFNGQIQGLNDAIGALKPGESTAAVSKAIEDMVTTAQNLSAAYQGAAIGFTSFKTQLDEYKAAIKAKVSIDPAVNKNDDKYTGLVALQETFDGFEKQLEDIQTLEAQLSYDAAIALKAAIDKAKVEGGDEWADLVKAETAFAKAITAANETYAGKQVEAAQKLYEDNKEVAAAAPIATINTAWATAQGNVTAAADDVAKLGACDTELQKLVGDCAAFTTDVNSYVAFMNQLKPLPDAITAAKEYNGETSMDPAKSYFDGVIAGYQTDYNTLVAELDAALAEIGKLTAGMPGEKGFTARANELETNVNGIKQIIQVNQESYDALLAKSKNVVNHLDEVIANFKANCQEPDALAGYLEAIEAFKTTSSEPENLSKVDVAVTGAYGKGALNEASTNGYINKYDAIIAAADALYAQFDGNVATLNAATAGTWTTGIAALRLVKDEAVKVYNAFFYDIKNQGYRDFINADLLTHQKLYAYTQEITKLESAIQAFIDKSNNDKVAFSPEDFAAVATTPMAEMTAAINADKDALIANMNRLGKEYWGQESECRGGVYQALYNSMNAAGMIAGVDEETQIPTLNALLAGKCPALQTAIDSWFAALTKHAAVVTKDAKDTETPRYQLEIGYAMDAIADLLDKVVYNETALEAAADILWDAYYKAFTDKAAADLASVDTDKAYEFAREAEKTAAKKDIQEQIDLAAEYNGQATAADASTLSVLQDGGKAALDGVDAEIQKILEELAKQSDANKASQDLYNDYTGDNGIIPGLNSDLQALIDYAASLGADSSNQTASGIATAKRAIAALTNFVEVNKGELADDALKAQAKTYADNADAAIAAGYTAVRNAEKALLDGIMVKVREAFNNAKAEGTGWTGAADYETKINAAIETLNGLAALNNADFQTAAQGLEKDLCNYLAELEAVYTHEGTNTAAVDAQARLTEQYEAVAGALDAAKTALAGCEESVKADYADAYAAIESDLAAVQAKREAAGNQIVALEGNIAADLADIAKAIERKKAEIENANQKAVAEKAIAAHAAELQEQIDGYSQQLDEIRSYLGTYMLDRPEALGTDITTVENMIKSAQAQLDQMVSDKTLTVATELPNAALIEQQLIQLNYNGHIAAVEYVRDLALNALYEAQQNLRRANLIPETRTEVVTKYNTAVQKYYDVLQRVTDGANAFNGSAQAAKDLETFIGVAEQAINDLVQLENTGREISETVYDNEFTPGDVDLDPDGDVTVADVQQVIAWVGEGVTYEDLLEQNKRQAYAADVNGNKNINISDVVAVLNIALGDLNNRAAAPRMLAKAIQTPVENTIALALNGTENGIREYAVLVNSSTAFVAGQLDLKVSAGMEIVDVELTGRAADHQVYRFDNSTGARVIVASMTNAEFDGNTGALLIVRTRGAGNLEVDGAVFADVHATGFGFGNEGMSGIDSITESCQNVKERIYNVAGQAMDRLHRGINIIRKSDGTTTKEMH